MAGPAALFVWWASIRPAGHSARAARFLAEAKLFLAMKRAPPPAQAGKSDATSAATTQCPARLRGIGAARQLRGRGDRAARLGGRGQPAGAPARAVPRHDA